MNTLENEYPDINFVYMTGHLDGGGEEGNLHLRNEQIRDYCNSNNKILYDFADIESYDPDGNYYMDKFVNDNCDYDSDGNGSLDKNWAEDWQNNHTEGVDWFPCSAAHSKALNGNLKAYAVWWLWARLAGWNPDTGIDDPDKINQYLLGQNYPNPFRGTTTIKYTIPNSGYVSIKLFDLLGKELDTFVNKFQDAGEYTYTFNGGNLTSGIYYYKLESENFQTECRKLIKHPGK